MSREIVKWEYPVFRIKNRHLVTNPQLEDAYVGDILTTGEEFSREFLVTDRKKDGPYGYFLKTGLFLDDVYSIDQVPPYLDVWRTVRTFDNFTKFISGYYKVNHKLPDVISFDGCLTEEQELYMANKPIGNIFYSTFKKECGRDCARWLIVFCEQNNIKLDIRIVVHEPFAQMNSDIQRDLIEFQKEQEIAPTVFDFKWKTKKED